MVITTFLWLNFQFRQLITHFPNRSFLLSHEHIVLHKKLHTSALLYVIVDREVIDRTPLAGRSHHSVGYPHSVYSEPFLIMWHSSTLLERKNKRQTWRTSNTYVLNHLHSACSKLWHKGHPAQSALHCHHLLSCPMTCNSRINSFCLRSWNAS